MKEYRHTITFVTEIDEEHMSENFGYIWDAMPGRDRLCFIRNSTKSIVNDFLYKANENGSWAIVRLADNG